MGTRHAISWAGTRIDSEDETEATKRCSKSLARLSFPSCHNSLLVWILTSIYIKLNSCYSVLNYPIAKTYSRILKDRKRLTKIITSVSSLTISSKIEISNFKNDETQNFIKWQKFDLFNRVVNASIHFSKIVVSKLRSATHSMPWFSYFQRFLHGINESTFYIHVHRCPYILLYINTNRRCWCSMHITLHLRRDSEKHLSSSSCLYIYIAPVQMLLCWFHLVPARQQNV